MTDVGDEVAIVEAIRKAALVGGDVLSELKKLSDIQILYLLAMFIAVAQSRFGLDGDVRVITQYVYETYRGHPEIKPREAEALIRTCLGEPAFGGYLSRHKDLPMVAGGQFQIVAETLLVETLAGAPMNQVDLIVGQACDLLDRTAGWPEAREAADRWRRVCDELQIAVVSSQPQ